MCSEIILANHSLAQRKMLSEEGLESSLLMKLRPRALSWPAVFQKIQDPKRTKLLFTVLVLFCSFTVCLLDVICMNSQTVF